MRTHIAISAVILIALSGCSSDSASAPTSPAATVAAMDPSSEPTPAPTPTMMSIEQAGDYYLGTVCASNKVGDANNKAFDSQSYKKIKKTARQAITASRDAAKRLDDETVIWPANVAKDILVIQDAYFEEIAYYETLSHVSNLEEANSVPYNVAKKTSKSAQRIRLRLELPSDTNKGC